jgi:alpha-mannosidase
MGEAAGLNRPPALLHGHALVPSAAVPIAVEGDIALEVLKKAEKENCLVVRLVECKGRTAKGRLVFSKAPLRVIETNLMEWTEEGDIPVKNLKAEIQMSPFQIRTFKIHF